MTTLDAVMTAVLEEAGRANAKWGDFTSTHEAIGVLLEEVDELRDAIRANKLGSVHMEAVQVAAVALRLAWHCEAVPAFQRRSVP